MLKKNNLEPNIVVDCSHGNSNKDHNRQPIVFNEVIKQKIDGNEKIIGIMLESNLSPGNQSLGDNIKDLEYGVSITDKCVGWEKTEETIMGSYDILK